MDAPPHRRLFEWFHEPRGFATLVTLAGLLTGFGLWLEVRGASAPPGVLLAVLFAGVTGIVLVGLAGIAMPARVAFEPKGTRRVVLVLLVIAVLAVTIPVSL